MFSGLWRKSILSQLQPRLANAWIVPPSAGPILQLNGGNVAALKNVARGEPMLQATPGNQPAHHASGGPNGYPYIELQEPTRYMQASMSVPSGNRLGTYILCSLSASGKDAYWVRNSGPNTLFELIVFGGSYRLSTRTGGTLKIATADTSPAPDTGWHLHSFQPLASGWTWKIDGTAVVTDFAETGVLDAQDDVAFIGAVVTAGGGFAACLQVEDPDAEIDEYVRAFFAELYS